MFMKKNKSPLARTEARPHQKGKHSSHFEFKEGCRQCEAERRSLAWQEKKGHK